MSIVFGRSETIVDDLKKRSTESLILYAPRCGGGNQIPVYMRSIEDEVKILIDRIAMDEPKIMQSILIREIVQGLHQLFVGCLSHLCHSSRSLTQHQVCQLDCHTSRMVFGDLDTSASNNAPGMECQQPVNRVCQAPCDPVVCLGSGAVVRTV